MQYVDEYRDPELCREIAGAIARLVTRPWSIMEVCGGQTHSIVRFGIDSMLPEAINLVHGPGCPVCVTPLELIDKAIAISKRPEAILCSFGDMLRVPGSAGDLSAAKAAGADIRVVYSPLEILTIARENPGKDVVFFAVGFETTAPTTAMTIYQAAEAKLQNVSLLVSHVLVPPVLETVLSSPDRRVDGVLAAGHVCTVMGFEEYEPIAARYRAPIVVTGFEPADILEGLFMCIKQLEEGRFETENQYARSVRRRGNATARGIVEEVFEAARRKWRGLGQIAESGLSLRPAYRMFDAEERFGLTGEEVEEPAECRSGLVMIGRIKPPECPSFGSLCTPENPLGAPMVSNEGACAAYYRYRAS